MTLIFGGSVAPAPDHGAIVAPIDCAGAESMDAEFDVIVVGGGNAALCAALAAREGGARSLVLECAPEAERGGNSRFTAGAMRVAYNGVDDLARLMPDLTDEETSHHRFRRLRRGPVLRRHLPGHSVPHRSRSGRDPGHAQLETHDVDARQGHALRADLRAPGVQDRRPVQVLGRTHGGGLGRRTGAHRRALFRRRPQRASRYGTAARALALLHDETGFAA